LREQTRGGDWQKLHRLFGMSTLVWSGFLWIPATRYVTSSLWGSKNESWSNAPLVVTFNVDEARRIVYVAIPFKLLSNSGL
jgi:hypothetical protein